MKVVELHELNSIDTKIIRLQSQLMKLYTKRQEIIDPTVPSKKQNVAKSTQSSRTRRITKVKYSNLDLSDIDLTF